MGSCMNKCIVGHKKHYEFAENFQKCTSYCRADRGVRPSEADAQKEDGTQKQRRALAGHGGGAGRRLRARDAAGLPQADGKGRAIKAKTPVPDGTGVFAAYFAYSTALVSRMTLTLIWPGYSSSDSIFLARSWASRIMLSSVTSSGLTMTRTSRPAWMA